jgi:hypothetical protein
MAGRALPATERHFFETRFGTSFASVRIHTGPLAHEVTDALSARAFTVGRDLVFGAGQYRPGTRDGRHLLAHELTHVVQQREGPIYLQRQERSPVDPEIAQLPAVNYVDAFAEVYYDLDYRSENGNLSTWLTVEYHDGTIIDINIYEFIEQSMDPLEVSNAMRKGYVGIGNRIFPRALTPQTAPRLWAARQEAIRRMEEFNFQFMMAAMPAVLFVITIGAGGVSSRPAPRTTRPRLSRSTSSRTSPRQGARQAAPQQGAATRGAAARAAASQARGGGRMLPRNAPEYGGFRSGITSETIRNLNRQFGGSTTITGHPSSALAAASRQTGFWKKVAAIVREVAGRHMFNDANKRTATAIVNELRRRNGVVTGVEGAQLRRVIHRIATGELRTIEEIARALRGF